MNPESVTTRHIRNAEDPLTVLTCYDYLTARVMDRVETLDMILVGDSLGMVNLGFDSTLPVTVDDMVHHTAAVNRGVDRAFLFADVPFLSTAKSRSESIEVAKRLMQEGGAQAVKIEGGERNRDVIDSLTDFDVPVIGHLGLTPQSVESFGGYTLQARSENEIKTLAHDAVLLEESGILALVLENVPAPVGNAITDLVEVPTIGIGAGANCDGQVLVWQDMMGLAPEGTPTFVKEYDNFSGRLREGVESFCEEVRQGVFPDPSHSFGLPEDLDDKQVEEWIGSAR